MAEVLVKHVYLPWQARYEDGGTFDDHQAAAVLMACTECGQRYYMTIPHPVCGRCREKAKK
jgi:hypothetical protein